jgi:uncharacterized protein (DUF1501 family)
MKNKPFNRRDFIKASAAGCLFMQASGAFAANALVSSPFTAKTGANKKLIWVFLRGALDGLHTVIPVGDPMLMAYRQTLLKPIQKNLLPLNSHYSLHPNLPFLHKLYLQKQMSPVVAVASGYRERSHFDAQDQMESGLNITEHDDGWLARAANQIQGKGIAISRSVPIALRGNNQHAETWYPSTFPEADEDLLMRLGDLYKNDTFLNQHLQSLVQQKQNPAMQMKEKRRPNFTYLAERCGELLANDPAANCAMLELGGWDTHTNQSGRLARLFTQLDKGLEKMQQALGSTWDDTLVVINTEFGRTVAVNGTQGTDHGTASTMFFAGGAMQKFRKGNPVKGGEVLGKWPGLAKENLYEERDLMPTGDIRLWIADALKAHWNLGPSSIKQLFPDFV